MQLADKGAVHVHTVKSVRYVMLGNEMNMAVIVVSDGETSRLKVPDEG